jgi:hypothetical protein
MDPTTMTWWLFALTFLVLVLTVLVALDLKRAWNRTASSEARRLIADAAQEAELAHITGPHRVPVLRPGETLVVGDGRLMPAVTVTGPIHPETVSAIQAAATEPATAPVPHAHAELLAPPPMIGDDTLRDWLIHYRKAPEAWTDVTREFYRRAAGVPEVADYFTGVDWPALQRHFTAALILLTHTGVTRDMPATAARWHHDVRNSAGDPITPEIYDAVIATLVGVLRDFDVPEDALAQLGRTVAPFRMAIARTRAPAAPELAGEARARAVWPTWSDQRGSASADGAW